MSEAMPLPTGVSLHGPPAAGLTRILTPEAVAFVVGLCRRFEARRQDLLARRRLVQERLDSGVLPDFLPETAAIREADWTVAPIPADLVDRRVEITGPVERKMIINALNSGASVFMADFEDSSCPTWENVIGGQVNVADAVDGTIELRTKEKLYRLNAKTAVLFVRPRGWHLPERHLLVDGKPASGSLVDFGLFFFHNARKLVAKGTGPYFYLPKLESHLEARLWNDVFVFAQTALGLPIGTIRATVLIETLPAAFEMDEILWELREHSAGLNCGRWDYIFSFIKKLGKKPEFVLPDRARVTMDRAFLEAYVKLLIKTCHRRGIHAMGGMAAQIPIKDDPEANARAMEKVAADKRREVAAGHDGTWVAHPGLVALAKSIFDEGMPGPNQLDRRREDVVVTAADLLRVPDGDVTEAGLRQNVNVGILYVEAWLRGSGCVPLYNLMEDAATAEISRTQVWQWLKHGRVTRERYDAVLAEELRGIRERVGEAGWASGRFAEAASLFDRLATSPTLEEFLTLPAYDALAALEEETSREESQRKEPSMFRDAKALRESWESDPRWKGIVRDYTAEDVVRLRGTVQIAQTLAELGAARLWSLLHTEDFVGALGAMTGNQAMQQVKAGLKAIYLSGWQVAADANVAGQMYPDQSLYPVNSVPAVVKRINQTLQRADQIHHAEGNDDVYWFAPIVADAEAGFGGPLNAFELMKALIEAGSAAVHFEDQLASEKKCGHMGGKVLLPTSQFIRTLTAARLAADVMGVPTLIVARTDANGAHLITSDIDERDRSFLTGERTNEGFFRMRGGLDAAIARGIAYAPYADLVWCETSEPNLAEARRFAESVHAVYPGKLLAYNCSPSFNWKKKLDQQTIAAFQSELAKMGYKFQFVTLAGFHALNFSMFELARAYKTEGMAAYSRLQEAEFGEEAAGYTAVRHQREVGTGYFDDVATVVARGLSSTTALKGSTEEEQFHG